MNATLFDQWGGRESTKFDGTRPHACPEKGGSTRSRLRGAWRAPREATSLARTCAVSKGRMPRSKSHAGGTGQRIWQVPREPRIESGMKKSNRALSLPSCAPGAGGTLGSCPAAKFARGPEIRAVQCARPTAVSGRVRGAPVLAVEPRTSARACHARSPCSKEATRASSPCPIDLPWRQGLPLMGSRGARCTCSGARPSSSFLFRKIARSSARPSSGGARPARTPRARQMSP